MDVHSVLTCLSAENTSLKKSVSVPSSWSKVFLFAVLDITILIKYSTAYEITLTIDKGRTLTVGMFFCVCVCVCKSMTVNGRNPSTNPHLSSWITDIINRRYSSISPVFPIQRWGAGLFPSLSADLMTFTKLPYACVFVLYIYIYTQREQCVWECVFLCACAWCLCLETFVKTWCCLFVLFVFQQYCRSIWFEWTVWFSSEIFALLLFFFAVICVDNHAAP